MRVIWTTYKEKIKRLSDRIIESQKPIRVLDAIKWDPGFSDIIVKSKYKEMPKVGPEYYLSMDLGYDPDKKIAEFEEILTDIKRELGEEDQIGKLLSVNCEQYIDTVKMLTHRGTKKFWELSRKLYGSPKDNLLEDTNTLGDLGRLFYSILSKIEDRQLGDFPEDISAKDAVSMLNQRFKGYFTDEVIRAKLSDGIVADASAGMEVVKIKDGALFSSRDVDVLEVHEGWVHVGTNQNGASQHVATWLAKGPPRVAATQEGLAVFMEILSFKSYPKRARQINDRVLGIDKAEDGANILELIEFYRTEGYNEADSLMNAKRVFRGGVVEGGAPFTKDIAYIRGFIENYNFMRAAIQAGRPYLLPFLFAGKLHVEDIPLLYQKYKEGIVDPPRFIPPQFRDLNGLVVWLGFSSFLNLVDLKRVQDHYDRLFKEYST